MSELLFYRIKDAAQKKKNMSVKELGSYLNIGENAIYSWKKSNPSIDKVQKVAEFLNVSTDYLLGISNIEKSETESLSGQEQELLMRFRRGSKGVPDDKKELYNRQAMDVFDYISKTMRDLDEKNKPD